MFFRKGACRCLHVLWLCHLRRKVNRHEYSGWLEWWCRLGPSLLFIECRLFKHLEASYMSGNAKLMCVSWKNMIFKRMLWEDTTGLENLHFSLSLGLNLRLVEMQQSKAVFSLSSRHVKNSICVGRSRLFHAKVLFKIPSYRRESHACNQSSGQ